MRARFCLLLSLTACDDFTAHVTVERGDAMSLASAGAAQQTDPLRFDQDYINIPDAYNHPAISVELIRADGSHFATHIGTGCSDGDGNSETATYRFQEHVLFSDGTDTGPGLYGSGDCFDGSTLRYHWETGHLRID